MAESSVPAPPVVADRAANYSTLAAPRRAGPAPARSWLSVDREQLEEPRTARLGSSPAGSQSPVVPEIPATRRVEELTRALPAERAAARPAPEEASSPQESARRCLPQATTAHGDRLQTR